MSFNEDLRLSREVISHESEAYEPEHKNILINNSNKNFTVFMNRNLLCEVSAIIACKVARLDF